MNDQEFTEAYKRYDELVHDPSFLQTVLELSYLENIIAQAHCMENIDPVFSVARVHKDHSAIYARVPYPRLEAESSVITTSFGSTKLYGTNAVKISQDSEAVRIASAQLLNRMKEEFFYPHYKKQFPQDV